VIGAPIAPVESEMVKSGLGSECGNGGAGSSKAGGKRPVELEEKGKAGGASIVSGRSIIYPSVLLRGRARNYHATHHPKH
jgi:hypothetical protein